MVDSVSTSASVFAETTPRQIRLRSKSLGLRLRATTPQDDGTRQVKILRRQLNGPITIQITEAGFVVNSDFWRWN